MRTRFDHSNKLFREIISGDNPDIKPDKAIEERLNYYYLLKQPHRKVHMNSFAGMFVWLFSMKSFGVKASLISVCLLYFLFLGNMNNNNQSQNSSDTSQISSAAIDTFSLTKDSCR
jgi:hypothetical protein